LRHKIEVKLFREYYNFIGLIIDLFNEPSDQSTNQPINQSTNQPSTINHQPANTFLFLKNTIFVM